MSKLNERPIRVLLVEDNPGDARLLMETLGDAESGQFQLTHVLTLSSGIESLAKAGFDVVLLDLSLPDSQGLETFARAHAQAPEVPFVVLTGLVDERLAAAALREGAQDYLVKGQVERNLLVRSMRYAIERKRAEDALSLQARELAVLEERNRMAREIHDTLAQGFTGIVLQLEAAEQALAESPLEAPEHLGRAKNLARESLQEARRSVWDLVPRELEQQPLETALRDEVQRFPASGTGVVSFSFSGERRELAGAVQAALLRICQESLTNARRYANATEVHVSLTFSPAAVRLEVEDNGIGFDIEKPRTEHRQGGFGLLGMEQRARLLNGTFGVKSREGEGTLVEVNIPTVQRGAEGNETAKR